MPARKWADNRCAAGALSEVLNHLGDRVTEEELAGSLTRARKGGVVSVDLLLAVRTRGFDAQILRGDQALVRSELELQHPLLLMLRVMDAPGLKDDLYHYVVLSGIDTESGLVQMHYGDGRKRWVPLVRLEPSWAAGGYATFLIGPRKQRTATEDDLRRAVVLEDAGKTTQAIALYQRYLDSHPQSVVAWTNLGNARARLGEQQLAEVAYRNALFLEKTNRDALNNLAWLLLGQGRLAEAESLARRAARQEGPDRYLALDTLARVLAAGGRCREAQATFDQALTMIPEHEFHIRTSLQAGLSQTLQDCR